MIISSKAISIDNLKKDYDDKLNTDKDVLLTDDIYPSNYDSNKEYYIDIFDSKLHAFNYQELLKLSSNNINLKKNYL